MGNRNKLFWLCLLGLTVVIFQGFSFDPNAISKRNVALIVPKGFPKPLYDFTGNKITPEGFVLGRMLFYDPILSKDSSISCASCHQQFAAFAHIDHKLSHGIDDRIGTRNVPALQNLIWKDNFMWDGRVNHIEEQPVNPITDRDEMNESLSHVIEKLKRSNCYKTAFSNAYQDTVITSERISKSLAQFTGLLISANAKYDRFINGEVEFNESETRGLHLFNSKCSSCHVPPLFANNAFAENGILPDTALHDLGRGRITENKKDNHNYKIPGLRNVEVTYPYMHDGRFPKLKQVLDHYGNITSLQKLADKRLRQIGELTESDKEDLISFLKTLTDRNFLYDRRFSPVRN